MLSRNPQELPPWPHWIDTGRAIVIVGRHLTVGRWWLAGALALLPVAAFDWYLHTGTRFTLTSTGWSAPPEAPYGLNWKLIIFAEFLQAKLPGLFQNWEWPSVYRAVIWPMYILSPIYFIVMRWLISLFVWKKTTVVFESDVVELPHRFMRRRRYSRKDANNIEFFVPQLSEGNRRVLRMRYGMNEPIVASFMRAKTAEAFCRLLPVALGRSATAQLQAFEVLPIDSPSSNASGRK